MAARKSTTPQRKTATPRTNTATALAKRLDDYDERLKAIEDIVGAAKRKQQQAAAAKLAQNPQQLNALRDLLAMADGQGSGS